MSTVEVRPDGSGYRLFEDQEALGGELEEALRRLAEKSRQDDDDELELVDEVDDLDDRLRSLAEETLASLQLEGPWPGLSGPGPGRSAEEGGQTWAEWLAQHPAPQRRPARRWPWAVGAAVVAVTLGVAGYAVGTAIGRGEAKGAASNEAPVAPTMEWAMTAGFEGRGPLLGTLAGRSLPSAEGAVRARTSSSAPGELGRGRRVASADPGKLVVAPQPRVSFTPAPAVPLPGKAATEVAALDEEEVEAESTPSPGAAEALDEEAEGEEGVDAEYAAMFADGPEEAAARVEPASARNVYVPPDPQSALPEGISRDDVMRVVLEHRSALAECAVKHANGEHGLVELRWSVLTDGRVDLVETLTANQQGSELAGCFEAEVRTFAFPAHRVEQPEIVFPFKF